MNRQIPKKLFAGCRKKCIIDSPQNAENCMIIAGVDEVGRGPLAGPVIAAAVILESIIPGVMDSKLLTPKKRKDLSQIIQSEAICYAIGRAEVHEIESLNIHFATLLAMKRAIEKLKTLPDKVLVDGMHKPQVAFPCYAIVKGDLLVHEISAASILAKVYRDEEMERMDVMYPGYGFAAHKGYPTAMHNEALSTLGICPIHRKNFNRVAQMNNKNAFNIAATL